MSQDTEVHSNNISKLLILMGILWLVLGGGLIVYQLLTPSVTVQWDTETELNTAGFNLYRSQLNEDDYVLVNTMLIDSEGSSVSGASYTYVDNEVEAGKTFLYLLEEIQNDGTANRYEDFIFSYTIPWMTWGYVILAAVVIVIGLGLLVIGIKDVKN